MFQTRKIMASLTNMELKVLINITLRTGRSSILANPVVTADKKMMTASELALWVSHVFILNY